MSASIYAIVHNTTGNEYVGMTRRCPAIRFKEHLKAARFGSQSHIHRAIRKYGEGAFELRVLEENVIGVLGDAERRHTASRKPYFNMTPGGEGGFCFRQTRCIINNGIIQKFHPLDDLIPEGFVRGLLQSVKEKMSKPGRKHTAESREKMSKSHLGKKIGPRTKKRVVSDETRAKMSEAHSAKMLSNETREKMRVAKLGKKRAPFSEETRARMRAAHAARRNSSGLDCSSPDIHHRRTEKRLHRSKG